MDNKEPKIENQELKTDNEEVKAGFWSGFFVGLAIYAMLLFIIINIRLDKIFGGLGGDLTIFIGPLLPSLYWLRLRKTNKEFASGFLIFNIFMATIVFAFGLCLASLFNGPMH